MLARYCIANTGKPILRQYWLNNIGQYCKNVDIPIFARYSLQHRANIVNNVAPISRQYCPILFATLVANVNEHIIFLIPSSATKNVRSLMKTKQ